MRDKIIIKTIYRNQCIIKLFKAISLLSFLIPFLLLFGFLDIMGSESKGFRKFILAAMCVVCILITGKIRTRMEKNLKLFIGENITKKIIAEKIDIQSYAATDMVTPQSIKASGIMPSYDIITGSDYIKGTYNGQNIEYCDLKMEQEYETTDDDGHTSTSYTVVFQGPFVRMPLGRELNGYVKIIERKSKRKKAGFISDLIKSATSTKKETTIELENEAFNNKFRVKTNDEELAFYILTPQFMENIMKADEYANGYTNISFINGFANIAIHNGRDAFEIRKTMYGKKQLEKSRANMQQDLNTILAIIDEILEKDRLFHA